MLIDVIIQSMKTPLRIVTNSALTCVAVSLCIAGCGDSREHFGEGDASTTVRETIRYEQSLLETASTETEARGEEPGVVAADESETSAHRGETAERVRKPKRRTRIADDRPQVNEARLQEQGIRLLRSQRLVLLTDRTEDDVVALPVLADALFERLEQHFGELLPAVDGSEFQVTGYLIADAARFEAAGLVPSNGLTFKHGRHLNYEFWMRDQADDYYRRHLLLHEFTHCFMTCESGMTDTPDAWYIEGMAEYFATHALPDSADDLAADVRFGVMPSAGDGFEGWGRIDEMRRAFDSRPGPEMRRLKMPSLDETRLPAIPNIEEDSRYAWWWALCWLINEHPFYREHLAELKSVRRHAEFRRVIDRFEHLHGPRWKTDWLLIAESMVEDFDTQRSFPMHGTPLAFPAEISISAVSGWQDTGIVLQAGESLHLHCEGNFVVATDTQPWQSEPQGVSVEYIHGAPLGQVVGILAATDGSAISNRISVGRGCELAAPWNGRLWLQINDTAASRADNSGSADATISFAE